MKMPCNVIKDLMLLYENGEASEETRRIVEEHIGWCSECRSLLKEDAFLFEDEIKNVDNPEEIILDKKTEVEALKNGLGKIKRRWRWSLASALMVLPVLLLGILTFHECIGSGIAFTNLDEIRITKEFMQKIEKGEFKDAADMLDYTGDYGSIVEVISNYKRPELIALYGKNPTAEEYKESRTKTLLEYLNRMKEKGYSISDIRFNHVFREEGRTEPAWTVQIAFVEHGPNDEKQNVIAQFACQNGVLSYEHAMEEKQMSAFEYAMNFNHMWHLDETPSYEEYLEMEKTTEY